MAQAKKGNPEEMRELMTKENFRDWLQQFGSRQKVGEAKNMDKRPIAKFMTEMVGEKALVTPTRTHAKNTHFNNPSWVMAYIEEIDTIKPNRIVKTRAEQILDDLDWEYGDRME